MVTELLIAAYCIGVAVDGFLRGSDAYFCGIENNWRRGDRERAWLASLLWPISMWLELGIQWRGRKEK